ncbi:MAG: glucose-6-phosphate isomerase [Candidatus Altiarchaeales archaeon]|nr:MAG: glucose-6-phosphate isomerase [Candidatus Altiarchaeales archaeon]
MGNELRFGDNIIEPDIRMLSDMKEVIYDREWLKGAQDVELYYMYRGLALNDRDREILRREHLRYDITVIPPYNLGNEFVKTAGHYHPKVSGTDLSYTEIYEVLEGRAHYLLQRLEKGGIRDVVLVRAEKGDKVVIPPDYGHITINPSERELRMANFVSDRFSSVYEPIREKGGGAYFELIDGSFIRNKNYEELPDLRFLKARDLKEFGIEKSREMYSLIETPERLRFLDKPQDFTDLFEFVLDYE